MVNFLSVKIIGKVEDSIGKVERWKEIWGLGAMCRKVKRNNGPERPEELNGLYGPRGLGKEGDKK